MVPMVKLTPEMKEAFLKAPVYPLATASKAGEPNVAPMKSVWLVDDETVWVADNYMHKSLANMQENPRAAIYLWGPETKGCLQVKGDVEVLTSGPDYEKMRAMVKAKSEKYPAKSLIRIRITDIFTCSPGDGAGKKVL
jgi:predicted pyridoxine 5'-phosphate oxidase superfamily flavin-nucleotide-binding protein